VRKGELLGAKWSELDLDGATDLGPVWRLPAKRTKTAAPNESGPYEAQEIENLEPMKNSTTSKQKERSYDKR
jgi:hypothetical protein